MTHKFDIGGHEGYITVGLYPDGQPGEIFLKMAKEGSTVSGLMDSYATAISLALQYGVPLRDLVNKFAHVRFEPSGFTGNSEIPIAKSIVDYIFRWLGSRFLSVDDKAGLGLIDRSQVVSEEAVPPFAANAFKPRADEGITAQSEAIASPIAQTPPAPAVSAPAPATETKPVDDTPKATAVAEATSTPAPESPAKVSNGELQVVATNGALANGNGHANGNGAAPRSRSR